MKIKDAPSELDAILTTDVENLRSWFQYMLLATSRFSTLQSKLPIPRVAIVSGRVSLDTRDALFGRSVYTKGPE